VCIIAEASLGGIETAKREHDYLLSLRPHDVRAFRVRRSMGKFSLFGMVYRFGPMKC
jgi:hypothetical protein